MFDIVPQQDATDPMVVGGKAASLGRLLAEGFDIPSFVVASPAFAARAKNGGAAAIARAIRSIGDGPYAVRSSATEEDSAAHSHAGQLLTLLGVDPNEVAEAVAAVAASGGQPSVQAYRRERGLTAPSTLAVMIQRQLSPRAAGVMFTADAASGRRDRIMISAVGGLADALVSGTVDGNTYALARRDGAVIDAPSPDCLLSKTDLKALWTLADRLERAIGAPQDVEWAFEDDRLYLLQARPITTPLRPAPITDDIGIILDNSNIIESYPGVVSPLTFSFAQHAYARVYQRFLALVGVDAATIDRHSAAIETLLAQQDGRVYYNLISWHRLLALLPGFRLNRSFMETMMGVGEPLPAEILEALAPKPARRLSKIREAARVAKMVGRLTWSEFRLRRTIVNFEARIASALRSDQTAVDAMSASELAAEYRRLEATLLNAWDAPLINDFLCMIAFGASRKLLERWAGPDGVALHNEALIGQGDVVSAEPPRLIEAMAEVARRDPDALDALDAGDVEAVRARPSLGEAFDDYLSRFGDRCVEELKLESAPLTDDPAPLIAAIAAAARRPAGPTRALQTDFDDRFEALFSGRPCQRLCARRVLAWSKARVRDRENLRVLRTRVFAYARRLFLAMGAQLYARGRIDNPRDVLLLSVQEILSVIEGSKLGLDLVAIAAQRRDEQAAFAEKPDPPERLQIWAGEVHTPAPRTPLDDRENRRGTACSAGQVRARVRIIRDARQTSLEAGEILVAPHTDPGWIALFANAGGVVVERGSLLSHSAIVARELGIPCVTGLRGACDWLSTGDEVVIDGATGLVRRVSEAPNDAN